jgi:hypothetical protein
MCQMPVVPALGQNSAQSSFSPLLWLVLERHWKVDLEAKLLETEYYLELMM